MPRSPRTLIFAACIWTASSFCLISPFAHAGTLLAPSGAANIDQPVSNAFPLRVDGGQRYQQVYDASLFGNPSAPLIISAIAFRPDAEFGGVFSESFTDVELRLSTTSAASDGLSATFADNIGGDETLVRDGEITLSSSNLPGPGDTRAFDVIIPFSTTFSYDPTLGNLLLDVFNNDLADSDIGIFFDATSNLESPDDGLSRVFGPEGNPSASSGRVDSLGLVTQFTIVPEPGAVVPTPSAAAASGLCGVGLLVYLRRRRRAQMA